MCRMAVLALVCKASYGQSNESELYRIVSYKSTTEFLLH
jgi:hypothetical protein